MLKVNTLNSLKRNLTLKSKNWANLEKQCPSRTSGCFPPFKRERGENSRLGRRNKLNSLFTLFTDDVVDTDVEGARATSCAERQKRTYRLRQEHAREDEVILGSLRGVVVALVTMTVPMTMTVTLAAFVQST